MATNLQIVIDIKARAAELEQARQNAKGLIEAIQKQGQVDVAILRARAAGLQKVGDLLQQQRNIQADASRLVQSGLGKTEATSVATLKAHYQQQIATNQAQAAAAQIAQRQQQIAAETRSQSSGDLALLRARATGNENLVRLLEQQRNIQADAARLVQGGLSQREAQTLAVSKAALVQQIATTQEAQASQIKLQAISAESARQQKAAQQLAAETRSAARSDIAILTARASGNQSLATALERQKAVQFETNRLVQGGLSLEEARALALKKSVLEAQVLARVSRSSSGALFQGIVTGATIAATQQLLSLLSQIPATIQRSVSDGVNFNATIESSSIGIASIVKAFDTSGKFQNFDAAIAESGRAVDFLKSKAVETEATFQELLDGYQAAAGPAFAAGIASTRSQVQLTVALSQAMSALRIPAREMSQEIRGVFEGDTSRQSRLNQVLRITKAEIDQASLSGTAYQLVMGRLKSFTEGAQRGQLTYNVAMSNFGDILTQLEAAGTEDLFERIKNKVLEINKELNKDQTREAVVGWAAGITSIVEKTVSGIKTMAAAIPPTIKAELAFERDLLFGSIGDDAALARAGEFAKKAQERVDVIEQSILAASTFAERLDAHVARERLILDLSKRTKDENGLIALVAQRTIPLLDKMAESLDTMRKNAQGTASAMQLTKAQIEAIIETSQKFQGFNLDTAAVAAKARDTTAVRKLLQEITQPSIEITGSGTSFAQNSIAHSEFEVRLLKERIDLQRQLVKEGKTVIEAAQMAALRVQKAREVHTEEEGSKTATEAAATAHKEIATLLRAQETTIAGIRQQQELINQNPYLTLSEKNAQLLALMRQEIATLNTEVAKGQALLAGGTLDPATYEQVRQKVQEARFEMELLLQKTSTLNFSGGLQENLLSWVNSMGTAAQQVGRAITGSIGTAIDATADALTGLIFQTRSWQQAALQAGQSIVSTLIKVGLQMIAQKVLGSVLTRTTAQEQTAAGAQVATSWAPAAAATSVGSFGSSAVVGAIAAAAAIAAIIALLVGFEKGGYTGSGGTQQIAGVVHGKEFVHDDPTVRRYGLPVMEAMRRGVIDPGQLRALVGNYRYQVTPRFGSFETGGAVAAITESAESNPAAAGRTGGETRLSNYLVLDPARLRKMIMEDGADEIWVTDIKSGRSYRVRGNRA